MAKHNMQRFCNVSFRRDLLSELDKLKEEGDSRNDVLERILKIVKGANGN